MATQVQKVAALIAGTGTLTLPNAVTAGNTIIVKVTAYGSAAAVTFTVTDNRNAGNYTQDAYISRVMTGAETQNAAVYHKDNTASSVGANSFIVTLTLSGTAGNSQAVVEEVSGLDSTSSFDKAGTNFLVGTTNPTVSASAPNSAASGYGAAAMALYAGLANEAITIAAPWVNDGVSNNAVANNPSSCDHKVIGSAETTSAAYTIGGGTSTMVGWVAALATFKDAAGASSFPPVPQSPLMQLQFQ